MGYTSTPESSSCCIMCLAHTFMTVFFLTTKIMENYHLPLPVAVQCQGESSTTSWSEGWWHHPFQTARSLRLNFFFFYPSEYLLGVLEALQGKFLDLFLTSITAQPNGDPRPRCPGCASHPVLRVWGYRGSPNSPGTAGVGSCRNPCIVQTYCQHSLLDSAQTLLFLKVMDIIFNRILK